MANPAPRQGARDPAPLPFPRRHRTAPDDTIVTNPPGIVNIILNEAAERFSFYGMKTILMAFMTVYLLTPAGQPDNMTPTQASVWYHTFTMGVYLFPVLGALLADTVLGKYRTIMYFSLVYCAGHAAMALNETRTGLALGLFLIALGSGGIKPCVTTHVGDQYGALNKWRYQQIFGWFYMSINVGGVASSLATPWLLEHYGPGVAFGVPGLLMAFATVVFWLGRNKFVHVPPQGLTFIADLKTVDGRRAIGWVSVILAFLVPFSSLYDQTGSSMVEMANQMDRHFFGIEWNSSQLQALNPALVLLLIPTLTYGLLPQVNKVVRVTELRKIGTGLALLAFAFMVLTYNQHLIEINPPGTVTIGWQVLEYVFITTAEVLVFTTAYQFAYTQAPKSMKSLIMAICLGAVALGNGFTGLVNHFIMDANGNPVITGVQYFGFFTALMTVAAVLYIPIARNYGGHDYSQDGDATAH